jgi:hypothetical protein
MSKVSLWLSFVVVLLVVVFRARADAASESCPATLFFWPQAAGHQTAAGLYSYEFTALTERSVDVTAIADTNAGWYEWSVRDVPIRPITVAVRGHDFHYTYKTAESAALTVQFPANVVVQHAWVTNAKTTGETLFGWDTRGDYTCEVPDLTNKGRNPDADNAPGAERAPAQSVRAPAVATPSSAPFPASACKSPFSSGSVSAVMHPLFPDALVGRVVDPTETVLYVAIDDVGRLIDAWVLAGSGYSTMDLAALSAARRTTYVPATSYCRHVGGVYVVQEEFTPY